MYSITKQQCMLPLDILWYKYCNKGTYEYCCVFTYVSLCLLCFIAYVHQLDGSSKLLILPQNIHLNLDKFNSCQCCLSFLSDHLTFCPSVHAVFVFFLRTSTVCTHQITGHCATSIPIRTVMFAIFFPFVLLPLVQFYSLYLT